MSIRKHQWDAVVTTSMDCYPPIETTEYRCKVCGSEGYETEHGERPRVHSDNFYAACDGESVRCPDCIDGNPVACAVGCRDSDECCDKRLAFPCERCQGSGRLRKHHALEVL